MADVSCVYTLTNSGSASIVFNDGSADQYYITEIRGIDGIGGGGVPSKLYRRPTDPVPFGNGTIVYAAWQAGTEIQVEGIFLITSTRVMNNILAKRNAMEAALGNVLYGMESVSIGTLVWTPRGQSAQGVTNLHLTTPLSCPHDQEYLVRTFSFGMFSGD